jgi:type II secretory pathway pseudopilin PulG
MKPLSGHSLGNERGATYLFLMFAVVLIGITTATAAKQWKVIVQREQEADLLAKGIEIQNALAHYSSALKAGRVSPVEFYPQSLAELTRLPKPYLRKVYLDPITRGEWEYLRSPTGGIMGVRSKSPGEPFKKHEFPPAVAHFDGLKRYRDWVFQHPNPSMSTLLQPPMVPVQPAEGATPPGMPPASTPVVTGETAPDGQAPPPAEAVPQPGASPP